MESPNITKKQFWAECLLLNPNWSVDANNKAEMQLIYEYLSRDESFNKGKRHLNKGLLLFGSVGSGKTLLIHALNRTLTRYGSELRFKITTPWAVAEEFSGQGYATFQRFRSDNWCFDELGLDERETGKYYGSSVNVAEALILERYNRFKQGSITHFTTNLSESELAGLYDDRTFSRLQEMCNFIPLVGPDRRENAIPVPKPGPVYPMVQPEKIVNEFEEFAARRPDLVNSETNAYLAAVSEKARARQEQAKAFDGMQESKGLELLNQLRLNLVDAPEKDWVDFYQNAYLNKRQYPKNWQAAKELKKLREAAQKGEAA